MKAMLLAAGRGERMGKLTAQCPKPLLPIAGKPLLQRHLERLAAAGVSEVVINTHYRAQDIDRFLAGWPSPVAVQVSHETELLETGGGIHNALPLLGAEPFLVINSDVWTDFPLQEFLQPQVGLGPQALAHLVLVGNPPHHPGGDFVLAGSEWLENLNEIPSEGDVVQQNALTFSGISLLSPALFDGCQAGRFALGPLLRQAIDDGRVKGTFYQGEWVDVGTPERLAMVEKRLAS